VMWSCQFCSPASRAQKLCSEQICGNFVIINCGSCEPHCSLPPS
jgi:hypothetical protein